MPPPDQSWEQPFSILVYLVPKYRLLGSPNRFATPIRPWATRPPPSQRSTLDCTKKINLPLGMEQTVVCSMPRGSWIDESVNSLMFPSVHLPLTDAQCSSTPKARVYSNKTRSTIGIITIDRMLNYGKRY
ncbi:hypothetical protein SRABI84_04879 [Peribacillus simplex]|nr:hypothetical protein SRABI84_04879 [Peribacillus simplex]